MNYIYYLMVPILLISGCYCPDTELPSPDNSPCRPSPKPTHLLKCEHPRTQITVYKDGGYLCRSNGGGEIYLHDNNSSCLLLPLYGELE